MWLGQHYLHIVDILTTLAYLFQFSIDSSLHIDHSYILSTTLNHQVYFDAPTGPYFALENLQGYIYCITENNFVGHISLWQLNILAV